MFHGGVPGPRRKHLVDRFREDESCRAFLATDSGGVGLNLQHASVVVNVDLPCNPAVLEQRIGRVHRLGQRQPVRVVNFVSQGTIKQGMLSVLKFKSSLFAGALDGGASEVLFEGGRLKRFMHTLSRYWARRFIRRRRAMILWGGRSFDHRYSSGNGFCIDWITDAARSALKTEAWRLTPAPGSP